MSKRMKNLVGSNIPEGKEGTEDEKFGENDIFANSRELYNFQDKFVHLLYNDMVQILLKNWRETDSPKSASIKNLQNVATSDENDKVNENEENKYSEEHFEKKLLTCNEHFKVEFPNRNIYTGSVSRKQMEGDGVYRWESGETYKGKFSRNSIEGKGHIKWKDQSWYEGEFHKGHRHGTGNFVSHEYGRFYIGQWYMGRKHGNGYCRYANKDDDFYDGEWKMDQKHGNGYRIYENGTRYIGQWANDQKHGIGTMVWFNGDVYRGEWVNGTMHGYGEYVWNGFFNKSLSWPQENSYMGEWQNGKRHGKGVLKLNSVGGAKYSGNWHMDKKHGYGMIIGNNGAVTKADPLFWHNILTPPDIRATDLPQLDAEITAVNCRENSTKYNEALRILGKHRKPRKTTVFEPLQSPSLWFHIQRLIEPLTYLKKFSNVSIPSGKCRVCGSEFSCTCLYNSPDIKAKEISETIPSSLDMGSSDNSSDQFCINPEKSELVTDPSNRTEEQYEEHWLHNCIKIHMVRLRKIYKTYAEIYCSEKDIHPNLSMGKIALWQLMRDCGIHKRGISLAQFERYIAFNKSAFIETKFYPFERIEFFQFIHALLEISWHFYTKLDDIETEAMRGRLAGGLYRLLTKDIFPNAGKLIGNVSTTFRDLLPLYAVYQLYCDIGEPHTAKQFLRATCILKGTIDPKPLPGPRPTTTSIPAYLKNGINAITVGEKLSYIPSDEQSKEPCPPESFRMYEDDLARELLALRYIGAPKMISIIGTICPGIKDEESDMIINMDYELTFLEFYEILLEATRTLLYAKKLSAQELKVSKIAVSSESLTRTKSSTSTNQSKRWSLNNSKIKKKFNQSST